MIASCFIPTRGWPFYGTIERLNEAGVPYQFMQGGVSIADVRNRIVLEFMGSDREVLFMCDDDVIPPFHFPDLIDPIEADEFDIVAGVVLTAKPGTIHMPNVFVSVGSTDVPVTAPLPPEGARVVSAFAVGTGLIAIHRRVFDKIRQPFAAHYDKNGVMDMGEDLNFCRKARSQGFRIAADYGVFCEHYDDVFANGLAQAYLSMVEEASLERETEVPPVD